MDTAELLQRVRTIEIKTRRLSRHLFTGGYHSAFKGRGMSFSEVRAYQYGDDIRSIDWNVTARTGDPFVKVFEEERELTVMLLVDVSASSFFGAWGEYTKQAFLTELSAVFAFSAIENHDKVGLLLYSDRPEVFVPPGGGRDHVLRIIRELLFIQPKGQKTNLAGAMQYLQNMLKKRSVCFILSDFQTTIPYDTALRVLSRRHDCVGLHGWDLRERELPDVGIIPATDPETGLENWLDATDPVVRHAYTRQFDELRTHTQAIFRKAGSDLLSLRTDEDYTHTLLHFFEQRVKRG